MCAKNRVRCLFPRVLDLPLSVPSFYARSFPPLLLLFFFFTAFITPNERAT